MADREAVIKLVLLSLRVLVKCSGHGELALVSLYMVGSIHGVS